VPVNLRDPANPENVYTFDDAEAQRLVAEGWQPESAGESVQRVTDDRLEEEYGGISGKIAAGGAGLLRGATLGLSDVGLDALGEGEDFGNLRDVNPGISTGGEIVGAIGSAAFSGGSTLATTPTGLITRAGARIAQAGEGAGVVGRAGRLVAGGAFEGGADAIGQAITQAALYDDPLDIETLGSQVLSNMLVGGGTNVAAAGLGKTLRVAKNKLDDIAARATASADGVADDLTQLDAAGLSKARKAELESIDAARSTSKAELQAARKAELDRIDAETVTAKKDLTGARQAELDAIEAERGKGRSLVADEIKAHRAAAKDDKIFLATQNAKTWEGIDEGLRKEVREVGKVSLEADKAIDRALRNPKALAANPKRALDALQQQESALETLVSRRPQLEDVFRADTSATRVGALDSAERALQRNRDLQAKITGLYGTPASSKLDEIAGGLEQVGARGRASTRLDEIQSALDDLRGPRTSTKLEQIDAAREALAGGRESFGQKIAGGAAYGVGASLVGSIPFIGPSLAPFAGAAASNAITGKLGGALTKATAEAAKRASSAVDMFLTVGRKVAPVAPIVATKVLSGVRYATEDEPKRPKATKPSKARLADAYKARTDEIKQQTAYQMGVAKMRPEARQRIAAKLAPIAMTNPILADRLETVAARKLEYLARSIPRRPDIASIPTGPDRWQPSDFEMRAFARKVAAVEDPQGVIERLADGTITPEDAEAMREVYPEMMTDITRQILERLPELRESLPYERRLALSIFTGAPVDAAMDPNILRTLQASFINEPGSEGGMQAPKPMPAFGSVKNQEATPSQQRQGATS
jgi:hypothetical protein